MARQTVYYIVARYLNRYFGDSGVLYYSMLSTNEDKQADAERLFKKHDRETVKVITRSKASKRMIEEAEDRDY